MPLKSTIDPVKVGDRYRVIRPKRLAPGQPRKVWWFSGSDARARAREKCAELMRSNDDTSRWMHSLANGDMAILRAACDVAGGAATLLDAAKFWRSQNPAELATLKELAIRTVAAKERSGKTDHYCQCLRRSLQLFAAGREGMLAHHIQPHHIEDFLNSNADWSQNTKRTYLRDIRTMFSFGVKNHLVTSNPAVNVERPATEDNSPAILPWRDCERFMRAAERTDVRLVQYLALCLFGGLRPSEAFRIQPENMKPEHIEVFGKKVRARNRRLVTINPTLRAWLEKFPGDYSPKNLYRRLMRGGPDTVSVRNATAVGEFGPVHTIAWPQDWMRHTFVSNSYATHGAKATANDAGHSETVLFQHYRELVSRADAERFWGIVPI